ATAFVEAVPSHDSLDGRTGARLRIRRQVLAMLEVDEQCRRVAIESAVSPVGIPARTLRFCAPRYCRVSTQDLGDKPPRVRNVRVAAVPALPSRQSPVLLEHRGVLFEVVCYHAPNRKSG